MLFPTEPRARQHKPSDWKVLAQKLPQGSTLQLLQGLGSQLKQKLVKTFSDGEKEEVNTSPVTRATAVLG